MDDRHTIDAGTASGGSGGAVSGGDADNGGGNRSAAGNVGVAVADVRAVLEAATAEARHVLESYADILGDDADLIAWTIEGETDMHGAIAAAIARIQNASSMAFMLDTHIKHLSARRDRLEAQVESLRQLVAVAMEAAQMKRIETPVATVSLRPTPPKVEVISEADIPARFWKPQDPKLDKRALLAALKAKEPIPGATLSNGGMTINVGMK